MGRKKKEEQLFDYGFEPSEYQTKIFDFIKHGVGNCVIKAGAGAGKTLTAVTSMKLIPNKQKCLFIAFNKSIVDELNKKLDGYNNVTVRTIHSLGFLMLKRNFKQDFVIDEFKYRTFVKNNIGNLTNLFEEKKLTNIQQNQYLENIIQLIDLSRFNNAQSEKEIKKIALKYTMPIFFDECEIVVKALNWGKENIDKIDYTDMVWLPNELSLKPQGLQYDWVFIDESQDLSMIAVHLFLKCFKRGTRFVSIGDENQSINQFAGSSDEAFNYLCNYPYTTLFDLPITYRCDQKITTFANKIVPTLLCRKNADEGKIKHNVKMSYLKNGDMVLARTKAPLIKLYTRLLRRNVKCYIKGQEIGDNLLKIISNYNFNELNQDLKKDGLFVRLYDNMFNERNKLMETHGLEMDDATLSTYIMNIYDTINTLYVLSENKTTKEQLIDNIKTIFGNENDGVCLSTIHKAKGLEADNVYILCHSAMPSKLAKTKWEQEQERNLMYVAYTRAKHCLGFIDENEIPSFGSMMDPSDIITELNIIENKICGILGKTPTKILPKSEIAKHNILNATKIEDFHKTDNKVVLNRKDKVLDKNKLINDVLSFIQNDDNATILHTYLKRKKR
mgnify:CR=1 FL=1